MYVPERKGETVLVQVDGDWVTGKYTGEVDEWGEHFLISLENTPQVDSESIGAHYEDIKEFTKENQREYLSS